MLILEQYGVKLVRLSREGLELVRYWRNHPDISSYMEFRETIDAEAQEKWFASINNASNYYFIIVYDNKKIGLINAKNYSEKEGFGEGGIFIWDKDHIGSFVPVLATLCLLNFVFDALKLCDRSHARILRNNHRAIEYNKLIGYELLPGQENSENQLYELTLANYKKKGRRLNHAAALLSKGKSKLIYSGTVCKENMERINQLLERLPL